MKKRVHVTEYKAQGHMSVCVRNEIIEIREGNVPRKPKQTPNRSYFYVLSGRKYPVFLTDEEGEPAACETAEEARACAERSLMSKAIGYIIIEMSDTGPVGEAT